MSTAALMTWGRRRSTPRRIALSSGPVVFAVEDTTVQLTWRTLPVGPVRFVTDRSRVEVESDGGPGAVVLDRLDPATDGAVVVQTTEGSLDVPFRTLASPPGAELFRFATISDVHLGKSTFGLRHTISEPEVDEAHPIRCARSALVDLTAWGAERLVVKGDLVDANHASAWALASDLLTGSPLAPTLLPGNHELAHGDQGAFARARQHGLELVSEVETLDVPGLRIVGMNSAIEDRDVGRWGHLREAAVDAVGTAEGPALLLVHHHPQPAPVPTHFPPGIDSVSARRFLRAVTATNQSVMGSSGHTHRHRFRELAGVPWSEVGSTKDYPGTWAGYVVHEGGIRQVVRRVSDISCLRWLDRTRWAAGGAWGLWSPGRLSDRCFTHCWPSG